MLLATSSTLIPYIVSFFRASYGLVSMGIVIFGFFGIRFFGQGVMTLVSRGMVAKWFGPRRGLAVGIMGLATAFGFSYAPQPLQSLIERFGWNGALLSIASFLALVFLPIVIIFFRSEPASCGLELEQGLAKRTKNRSPHAQDARVDKTVTEARREPVYWVLLVILWYWSLFNTAFTFHVVSIFNEIGIEAQQAVKIFLPISVVSVASRFLGSYVSDRISIKYLYIVFLIALILASACLTTLGNPIVRIIAIASYGVGSGLFGMLNIITWPKLYGRKHLGAVSGFAMSMIVAGSAIGPWIFSLAYRFTGSYRSAGIFGVICSVIFLIILLSVKFYRHQEEE
jgi:predicted MFS family arabinose efflux permease